LSLRCAMAAVLQGPAWGRKAGDRQTVALAEITRRVIVPSCCRAAAAPLAMLLVLAEAYSLSRREQLGRAGHSRAIYSHASLPRLVV
jgi:hypothetical protein